MRLIDAEKLRAEYLGMPNCYNGFSDSYDKAMIVDMVDEQPTIDAVQVVRCKDCRHLKQEFQWNGMPYKTCEFHGNGFPDDWYCADGERKDDRSKEWYCIDGEREDWYCFDEGEREDDDSNL